MEPAETTDQVWFGAVSQLDILRPAPFLEPVAELAAVIATTPSAVVGLSAAGGMQPVAVHGFETGHVEQQLAHLARTLDEPSGFLEIPETETHLDNYGRPAPLDTAAPNVRFFAGVAVRDRGGRPVGSLGVLDHRPRRLTCDQRHGLVLLARHTRQLLEASAELLRHQQERAATEIELTRQRRIFAAIGDFVFVQGSDRRIKTIANPRELDFDLDVSTMLGDDPYELVHPDDRDRVFAAVTRLLEAPGSTFIELRILQPDGNWVDVESYAQSYPSPDGDGLEIVHSVRTIEALRAAQRQRDLARHEVEREVKRRAALLRALSHDMAAPLASVRILAEAAAENLEVLHADERRRLVARLGEHAARAEGLAQDLLAVDLLEADGISVQPLLIDVSETVARAVDAIGISSHRIELRLDLIVAAVDRVLLRRITHHLVGNAVKHTPPGGSIWVELHSGPEMTLLVEDDGPGIPAQDRGRLVGLLERGDDAADRPGTGVGLYLADAFTRLLGGELTIEDRSGGGTRVSAVIPISDHAPPPAHGP